MAQSKKEQILALSNKIDSLNSVLNNERSLSLAKIAKLNSEIDLISKKLIAANDELIKVSKDFDKKKGEVQSVVVENKKLESDLNSMKEENSILKLKVDSALKSSLTIEMVFVEGGTFLMGSSTREPEEKPVHSVTLSSYNIGKYEVTQYQWKTIMGSNPSHFTNCDNCPVETVSWNEVQEFIERLNAESGKNYRLPTEAEWEFAARGGSNSKGYKYSGANDISIISWCAENSGNRTHEVGTKLPNELGIYDMTGNVWEWCSDWYSSYSAHKETNPKGPYLAKNRVIRGESYYDYENTGSTTFRAQIMPDFHINGLGFRLVLLVSP